jgi:hypothetical protein
MCIHGHLEQGSHVFAIYPNNETELTECFSFLKMGLDNNEAIFMLLENLSKEEIFERIAKELDIENVKDVKRMESNGDMIITTALEWYYPDGILNTELIQKRWESIVLNAIKQGKNGLRAFVDTSAFFKDGFGNDIIEYDAALDQKFSFPLIAVCAYKSHDVKRMTSEQLDLLNKNHGVTWINEYEIFANSSKYHYIGLLDRNENDHTDKESNNGYSLKEDKDEEKEEEYIDAIIENIINEGLRNKELCVYAPIDVKGNNHLYTHFAKKINDCLDYSF